MRRSSLLGRLADMLALMSSCLRGTVSEIGETGAPSRGLDAVTLVRI
jgi:hypothetical protein